MKRLSLLLFLGAFLLLTPVAHASFFGDVTNSIKKFFHITSSPQLTNSLSVVSSIALAKNGDLNHDGIINGGDIVEFSYLIKNLTNTDYPYATLKTNIARSNLYYVNNIQGAFSMDEKGATIMFPNLYIHAHQIMQITFDAYIVVTAKDVLLTTQPQIIAKNNVKVADGQKTQLQTKGITNGSIHSQIYFKTSQ